jgi:hypothetical protein
MSSLIIVFFMAVIKVEALVSFVLKRKEEKKAPTNDQEPSCPCDHADMQCKSLACPAGIIHHGQKRSPWHGSEWYFRPGSYGQAQSHDPGERGPPWQ